MQDINFIGILAVITLLLGLGYGVWQLFMVKRAKENHEHSSVTGHVPAGSRSSKNR